MLYVFLLLFFEIQTAAFSERTLSRYTLHVTRYHVTRYTLPVTRYTLPVTRYPLHVTRYPLHVTRYQVITLPATYTCTLPGISLHYILFINKAICLFPQHFRLTLLKSLYVLIVV